MSSETRCNIWIVIAGIGATGSLVDAVTDGESFRVVTNSILVLLVMGALLDAATRKQRTEK